MNSVELVAIARTAIPPVGAVMAVASVDHRAGRRLANGDPAGEGGVTRYQARWFDGLRQLEPVGPAFRYSRDMYRLIDLINGKDRPASRRSAEAQDQPTPEAPDDSSASGSVDEVRLCDGCDKPLPPGARRGRRCHGPACRAAAYRRRLDAETHGAESTDVPRSGVTLSSAPGPSDAPTPGRASRTPADPASGTPGSAGARDARPDAVPAVPGGIPSLGL